MSAVSRSAPLESPLFFLSHDPFSVNGHRSLYCFCRCTGGVNFNARDAVIFLEIASSGSVQVVSVQPSRFSPLAPQVVLEMRSGGGVSGGLIAVVLSLTRTPTLSTASPNTCNTPSIPLPNTFLSITHNTSRHL